MAVGRVLRPHGLSGEVVVESLTDFPERFSPGKVLQARFAEGTGFAVREVRVKASRPHAGRLLLVLESTDCNDSLDCPDSIDSPGSPGSPGSLAGSSGAEALRGADLCVLPGDDPPRPPGYWFGFELEGLPVVDRAGRALGRVRELTEAGGRSLLVVQTPRGPRDVPFCEPIVVAVDPPGNGVVLDPPRGLLD